MKSRFAFLVIFAVLLWGTSGFAVDSYQVTNGGQLEIDEHSVCKIVVNSHPSGKNVFVPTKTSSEWASFRSNLPSGVTLQDCCVGSAPTSINYSSSSYSWGTPGTDINTLTPTVGGGTPTSYSVSPSLPTGISLNTSNGEITGRPTATASSSSYTVTATNNCGSTNVALTIEVFDATAVGSPHDISITSGGGGGNFVDSVSSTSTTTVTVGTTLKWTNTSNGQHYSQSESSPKVWDDVPKYGKDGTQFLTLNMTGTLPMDCGVHSGMTATIISNP